MKVRTRLLGALAFAVALGTLPVSAQTASVPKEFGTEDEAITVIGSSQLTPMDSADVYDSDPASGTRWCGCGGAFLQAPLDVLPNGSLLTQFVAYISDDNAVSDVSVYVCRNWIDSGSGGSPGLDCPVFLDSSGAPGDSLLVATPNLPILYRQDVDGDGDSDIVNYTLRVYAPTSNAAIRKVRLRWKRQVSPAPQNPTFIDVPTNHQFFQFIEALADSGITAGCDTQPPLFCPDRTLTRGEMAVFLAKALGLHWPWDAP